MNWGAHRESELFSFCVFKHSWRINFKDNATLSTTFKSHGGNCEWFFRFQRKSNNSYCASEKLLCSENESLEVRLNDFSYVYSNSNTIKNRKIVIQICNANNEDDCRSINKEVYIDKLNNIVLIPFVYEEERRIDEFVNQHGYLTIVVKIFDSTNIICETNNLSDGFKKLLKLEENCNFNTLVDRKEHLAHQNILPTGQKDNFSITYAEQIKECVKISKMRTDVITEFLRYVYTRKVNITDETVFDLLYAANRYEIHGLKLLCEQKMDGNLT